MRYQGYFAIEEIAQIQEYDIRTVIGDLNAARRLKEGSVAPLRKVLHRAECAVKSQSGKALLRKRGMHLERSFEHIRDEGGLRSGLRSREPKISRSGIRSRRPATLLESAREELATSKPEQFKIFLLAAMAGLRRNEIDKLSWTAFRWDEGIIRIEATQFFRPKTSDSEGDVLVDPELLEIFRGYFARAKSGGEFVIESSMPADPTALYDHYRCQSDIQELIVWLRSKTPLHALRKEYGSQINARYGLTAASEMLRHADVVVTAAHYVENKRRSVLGFGHLLKSERTIIPIDGEAACSAP